MRLRALLLTLPLLAGCGGRHDDAVNCTTDIAYTPNAAYVGDFVGTYTAKGSASSTLAFPFAVDASGNVTGSYSDASGAVTTVTGRAVDVRSGCDDTQVAVLLSLTPASGTAQALSSGRKRSGALSGSYSSVLGESGAGAATGTFVVSSAVQPG